jgi:7-cyano-7-deazaguanine reductase
MVTVSYERFIDLVFEHLMQVYEPRRLRLVIVMRPRGGISPRLTIDSSSPGPRKEGPSMCGLGKS